MDVTVTAHALSQLTNERLWQLNVGPRPVASCWLPEEANGTDAFKVLIKEVIENE